MSVLLISAPFNVKYYVAPQLGSFRLQSYIKKFGIDCDIFDPEIDDINSFLENGKNYTVIGISGVHFGMEDCLNLLNKFTKNIECQILAVGGVSPSNNWQQWLMAGADIVILGYGEKALLELCKRAESGMDKTTILNEMLDIPGIACRKNNNYYKKPSEKMTFDTFFEYTYKNTLELNVPYMRYWNFNKSILSGLETKNNHFTVETVRIFTASQCPNHCGYCSAKFLSVSQDTPAKIFFLEAEEIYSLILDNYIKYHCKLVFFNDDEFLFHRNRIRKLCQLIIKGKQNGELPQELKFECQSRVVDFLTSGEVDRDFIRLLKTSGFNRISIGVESFSERLLKSEIMNKYQYTFHNIQDLVKAFSEIGILIQINIMLLIPDATKEEVLFNIKNIQKFLEKGTPINVNVKLFAEPGAPAITNTKYQYTLKEFKSPVNKYSVSIPEYFIPQNKDLIDCFYLYDDFLKKETEKFLRLRGISHSRLLNTYRAGIACLTVLRILGMNADYDNFLSILLNI